MDNRIGVKLDLMASPELSLFEVYLWTKVNAPNERDYYYKADGISQSAGKIAGAQRIHLKPSCLNSGRFSRNVFMSHESWPLVLQRRCLENHQQIAPNDVLTWKNICM